MQDVPPVLPATRHFLVNVYRYNMFFVGVLVGDVRDRYVLLVFGNHSRLYVSLVLQMSSLFVVELLHRIVDTLEHYLDFNVSEKTIRRQFSVVYQVCWKLITPTLLVFDL